MKVRDLKDGMLLVPALDKGWWPILSNRPSQFPDSIPYMKTNCHHNCRAGSTDPAIYMGKIKFQKPVHGLYTYHQLLYNGTIYLIDGYEFNGRIDPL